MNRLVALAGIAWGLAGCVASFEETDTAEAALTKEEGVNGKVCEQSTYNCRLRSPAWNYIVHVDKSIYWPVDLGAQLRDGNGDPVGVNNKSPLTFNYGQTRWFDNEQYVLARDPSDHRAGWFPVASVHHADAFTPLIGDVPAHKKGLKTMGCYALRDVTDAALAEQKTDHDTSSKPGAAGEAAGDYLPKVRSNNQHYTNLLFNMPGEPSGFKLGGVAVDNFPAGTKFQRLEVPTDHGGPPHIDVQLWKQDKDNHLRFTKKGDSLTFIYGYIVSKGGGVRVGWMALQALSVSSGCP